MAHVLKFHPIENLYPGNDIKRQQMDDRNAAKQVKGLIVFALPFKSSTYNNDIISNYFCFRILFEIVLQNCKSIIPKVLIDFTT